MNMKLLVSFLLGVTLTILGFYKYYKTGSSVTYDSQSCTLCCDCYEDLHGKVVLVTGASGGIGNAIARSFSMLGAKVAIHYHSRKTNAEALRDEINDKQGEAEIFFADFNDNQDIVKLVDSVIKKFGKIDILINNAAIVKERAFSKIDGEYLQEHINVNLLSPLLLSKEVISRFSKEGGSIVNISSINALFPSREAIIYSASKAALNNITAALAKVGAEKNVRVNGVMPGLTATARKAKVPKELSNFINNTTLIAPRMGYPEEIAEVVVFLATNQSRWITGQVITVDGGMSIGLMG